MPDPQSNQDAEKAVLGSCLNSPAAMATAVKVVRPEDFYVPAHETIWDAMLTLHDTGQSVDQHTVRSALTRSGDLQRVGGLLVIADLIGTGINAPRHLGVAKHCDSPSCPWWKCERCGASNDTTGANDSTDRSGNTRPDTTPRSTR